MIHGVDVSGYQAGWSPAPEDEFVFVKQTEGQTYLSPDAPAQLAEARKAGLVCGHYHYLWPSSSSGTPEKQAGFFVDTASEDLELGDLLVCDWEPTGGGTAPEAEAARFIAETRRLLPGHLVGVYVNRSMWNGSSRQLGQDFLWLAAYDDEAGVSGWDFWQYTDHPIDQNHGDFASRDALRSWSLGATGGGAPAGLFGMTEQIYERRS